MRKTLLRAVSAVTLICFLTTGTSWAVPDVNVSGLIARETPTFLQIEIPQNLASIEDIYEAPAKADPSLILHIQNLHGNYEAQAQIKKLLDYLYKTYAFKLIFVEGAAEKLNADYLRLFSDAKQNSELADYLTQKGQLTGPEFYLVDGPKDVEAVGIEQADLYRKNLEAFRKVYSFKAEIDKKLADYDSKIDSLSTRFFSGDARNMISEWRKFESGHRDFLPYAKRLAQEAKKTLGLDLESLFAQVEWPQMTRLLVIQSMESDLNKKAADDERLRLVQFLGEVGVDQEIIAAVKKLGERRISMSRLDSSGKENRLENLPRYLLERLVAEAGPKGFYFHDYPAFSLYAGYLILQSELQSQALYEEINLLFEKILAEQTPSEKEKNLLELFKDQELLKKLMRLELTRKEWKRASYRKEWIKPETMERRLRDMEASPINDQDSQGAGQTVEQPGQFSPYFNTALEFYDFARSRENAFFEAIDHEMKASKSEKAVLVTGGFHTEGLMDVFREHEINYGVLLPRISGKISDAENHYSEAMMENGSTMFDLATIEINSLLHSPATYQKMGGSNWKRVQTLYDGYAEKGKFQSIDESLDLINRSSFSQTHKVSLLRVGRESIVIKISAALATEVRAGGVYDVDSEGYLLSRKSNEYVGFKIVPEKNVFKIRVSRLQVTKSQLRSAEKSLTRQSAVPPAPPASMENAPAVRAASEQRVQKNLKLEGLGDWEAVVQLLLSEGLVESGQAANLRKDPKSFLAANPNIAQLSVEVKIGAQNNAVISFKVSVLAGIFTDKDSSSMVKARPVNQAAVMTAAAMAVGIFALFSIVVAMLTGQRESRPEIINTPTVSAPESIVPTVPIEKQKAVETPIPAQIPVSPAQPVRPAEESLPAPEIKAEAPAAEKVSEVEAQRLIDPMSYETIQQASADTLEGLLKLRNPKNGMPYNQTLGPFVPESGWMKSADIGFMWTADILMAARHNEHPLGDQSSPEKVTERILSSLRMYQRILDAFELKVDGKGTGILPEFLAHEDDFFRSETHAIPGQKGKSGIAYASYDSMLTLQRLKIVRDVFSGGRVEGLESEEVVRLANEILARTTLQPFVDSNNKVHNQVFFEPISQKIFLSSAIVDNRHTEARGFVWILDLFGGVGENQASRIEKGERVFKKLDEQWVKVQVGDKQVEVLRGDASLSAFTEYYGMQFMRADGSLKKSNLAYFNALEILADSKSHKYFGNAPGTGKTPGEYGQFGLNKSDVTVVAGPALSLLSEEPKAIESVLRLFEDMKISGSYHAGWGPIDSVSPFTGGPNFKNNKIILMNNALVAESLNYLLLRGIMSKSPDRGMIERNLPVKLELPVIAEKPAARSDLRAVLADILQNRDFIHYVFGVVMTYLTWRLLGIVWGMGRAAFADMMLEDIRSRIEPKSIFSWKLSPSDIRYLFEIMEPDEIHPAETLTGGLIDYLSGYDSDYFKRRDNVFGKAEEVFAQILETIKTAPTYDHVALVKVIAENENKYLDEQITRFLNDVSKKSSPVKAAAASAFKARTSSARSETRVQKVREKQIAELVRQIGQFNFDEMEVKSLRRRIRKLNRLLAQTTDVVQGVLDGINVYTAFIPERLKEELPNKSLQEVLDEGEPPQIQTDLMRLLDRLGSEGAEGRRLRLHDTLVRVMVLALINPNVKVRYSALRALLNIPKGQSDIAYDYLKKMASDPDTAPLLLLAIIGHFEKRQDVDSLRKLVRAPNLSRQLLLQLQAIRSFGKMGDIDELIRIVYDSNGQNGGVRSIAAALEEIARNAPIDVATLIIASFFYPDEVPIHKEASRIFDAILVPRINAELKSRMKPRFDARAEIRANSLEDIRSNMYKAVVRYFRVTDFMGDLLYIPDPEIDGDIPQDAKFSAARYRVKAQALIEALPLAVNVFGEKAIIDSFNSDTREFLRIIELFDNNPERLSERIDELNVAGFFNWEGLREWMRTQPGKVAAIFTSLTAEVNPIEIRRDFPDAPLNDLTGPAQRDAELAAFMKMLQVEKSALKINYTIWENEIDLDLPDQDMKAIIVWMSDFFTVSKDGLRVFYKKSPEIFWAAMTYAAKNLNISEIDPANGLTVLKVLTDAEPSLYRAMVFLKFFGESSKVPLKKKLPPEIFKMYRIDFNEVYDEDGFARSESRAQKKIGLPEYFGIEKSSLLTNRKNEALDRLDSEIFKLYKQIDPEAADIFQETWGAANVLARTISNFYFTFNFNHAIAKTYMDFPVVILPEESYYSPFEYQALVQSSLAEYAQYIGDALNYLLSAPVNPAAEELVKKIAFRDALLTYDLSKKNPEAPFKIPPKIESGVVFDAATGPNGSDFIPALDPRSTYYFSDIDAMNYLTYRFQADAYLFDKSNLTFVHKDLRSITQRDIGNKKIDLLRVKNAWHYVPGFFPGKLNEMIEWLSPGGVMSLEADRSSLDQFNSIIAQLDKIASRLLAQGWSFEFEPNAGVYYQLRFTKPLAVSRAADSVSQRNWANFKDDYRRKLNQPRIRVMRRSEVRTREQKAIDGKLARIAQIYIRADQNPITGGEENEYQRSFNDVYARGNDAIAGIERMVAIQGEDELLDGERNLVLIPLSNILLQALTHGSVTDFDHVEKLMNGFKTSSTSVGKHLEEIKRKINELKIFRGKASEDENVKRSEARIEARTQKTLEDVKPNDEVDANLKLGVRVSDKAFPDSASPSVQVGLYATLSIAIDPETFNGIRGVLRNQVIQGSRSKFDEVLAETSIIPDVEEMLEKPGIVAVLDDKVPTDAEMKAVAGMVALNPDLAVQFVIRSDKPMTSEQQQLILSVQKGKDKSGKVIGNRFGVFVFKESYAVKFKIQKMVSKLAGQIAGSIKARGDKTTVKDARALAESLQNNFVMLGLERVLQDNQISEDFGSVVYGAMGDDQGLMRLDLQSMVSARLSQSSTKLLQEMPEVIQQKTPGQNVFTIIRSGIESISKNLSDAFEKAYKIATSA